MSWTAKEHRLRNVLFFLTGIGVVILLRFGCSFIGSHESDRGHVIRRVNQSKYWSVRSRNGLTLSADETEICSIVLKWFLAQAGDRACHVDPIAGEVIPIKPPAGIRLRWNRYEIDYAQAIDVLTAHRTVRKELSHTIEIPGVIWAQATQEEDSVSDVDSIVDHGLSLPVFYQDDLAVVFGFASESSLSGGEFMFVFEKQDGKWVLVCTDILSIA